MSSEQPSRTGVRSGGESEARNPARPIRSIFPTPPRRTSTDGDTSRRPAGLPAIGRALKSGARVSSVSQGRPSFPSVFSVKKTTQPAASRSTGSSAPIPIPSRVRFQQHKSASTGIRPRSSFPIISAPARKAGSRPSNAATPQSAPSHIPSKTPSTLLPLWQDLDREREERTRRNKRAHGELGGFTRRMTSSAGHRGPADAIRLDVDSSNRPKTHIASKMILEVNGVLEILDSDEDELRYRSARRVANRKVSSDLRPQVAMKKTAMKAARKIEYADTSSSGPSSSDDESMRTRSDIDELDVDNYTPPPVPIPLPPTPPARDVEMGEPAKDISPPPILLLDTPPKITIPLPQIDPAPVIVVDEITQPDPPDQLVAALEMLSLPSIRMQSTRQLPFIRRNLRRGFSKLCRGLEIDVYSNDKEVSLTVLYEYAGGISHEAEVSDWLCPLCELFGSFETKEMLGCHLSWDHAEVFHEWHKIDEDEDRESWKLQILISEPLQDRQSQPEATSESVVIPEAPRTRLSLPPIVAKVEEEEPQEEEEGEQEEPQVDELMTPALPDVEQPPATPQNRNVISSPFPSVSLSPPSVRRQSPLRPIVTPSKLPQLRQKTEVSEPSSVPPSTITSEPPPSIISPSRGSTIQTTAPNSRSRSTTGNTLTTTTTTTRTTATTTRVTTSTATALSSRSQRCVTPPPQDNPLGPATQPPYLPAKSDYGGPTVYYSSRPGGPCLFDLLGTLPMEKFGVLDWDVIDREEEIYETDEVKEEYKVMHALWARWILLNRTKFISNYLEGAMSFVDEYWKIIHRAAGWDALRYWLFILVANQFLTAGDTRKILLYYEEHTGMASWYD
ncbi:unnamed protein product [Cyclocybe aegerita]|uniref:Uncharacterized protein n=1 Tax=Cyclocybe aegerita TaxID=1973307 RepID=A0A8S0WSW4_CYCAE|nr:unnamed protein product [Cyclocybe aegerita]